jgi:hypothetical protein
MVASFGWLSRLLLPLCLAIVGQSLLLSNKKRGSHVCKFGLESHGCRYGSPTIDEIQQFSSSYSKSLERSGEAGIIPKNLAFEVWTPSPCPGCNCLVHDT